MCTVEGAIKIFGQGPLHVVPNYQVQLAIAIVVHPRGAGSEALRSPETRSLRDVRESTVPALRKR